MRVTCPNCHESYPIAAGVADEDAKRLAAMLAGMDATLGRAVIGYLRLFRPAKTALRNARALKIVQDLVDLVAPGSVCRDERGGLRRPATPALWAAGIEQMLAAPGKLALPLANHHYLRAIVYGLADQADASAERTREVDLRAGRQRVGPSPAAAPEDALRNELAWLRQQRDYGQITQDEHDERAAAARARHKAGGAQ